MIFSAEEVDRAVKEAQSYIGERTIMGQAASLRYNFLRLAVDAEEWCTDNAEVLQKDRKELDEWQRKLLNETRAIGADTDNLKPLFTYQWEEFANLYRDAK